MATETTDKGIALSLLFGIVAAAAALYMLVGGRAGTAFGFAVAVALASLAVSAFHLFE